MACSLRLKFWSPGVMEGGEPVWSEYSVESMYPTAGHTGGAAAAAATNGAAAAPAGHQQRSGRRKKVTAYLMC